MIVSGHQVAYLPWLGYFHKLSLCDTYVYMDTVQFVKNDWHNRNKIKTPQGWMWLSVPVDKRKTQGKGIHEVAIRGFEEPDADDFWQRQHWQSIEANYRKSPYFKDYADELATLYLDRVWERLVDVCWAQFCLFRKWLGLGDKKIVRMSEQHFEGYKDELVLDHCRKLGADKVVFGALGKDYVRLEVFRQEGIGVYFQDYKHPEYPQRFGGFEPFMSVIDLVFNCGPESRSILLKGNLGYEGLKEGEHWL